MTAILKIVGGLLLVALPFVACFRLLRKTKRNQGGFHGGGIRRYWDIRNGRG